jgi:hypothetical protein
MSPGDVPGADGGMIWSARDVVGSPTAPGVAMGYPPSKGPAMTVTGSGRSMGTGHGLQANE